MFDFKFQNFLFLSYTATIVNIFHNQNPAFIEAFLLCTTSWNFCWSDWVNLVTRGLALAGLFPPRPRPRFEFIF